MQMELLKAPEKRHIENLSVVRNFRKVIEAKDIGLMKKELYQFLNLYCGFIAHYDINGFKAVYSPPRDFADVFIRHFDSAHRYFNGIYSCHGEAYRETGFTKAEVKEEFYRIVDLHKGSISKWAENRQRDERRSAYMLLKDEFQGEIQGAKISCEACGNEYEIKVIKGGDGFEDFRIICCLFCGQQIKL